MGKGRDCRRAKQIFIENTHFSFYTYVALCISIYTIYLIRLCTGRSKNIERSWKERNMSSSKKVAAWYNNASDWTAQSPPSLRSFHILHSISHDCVHTSKWYSHTLLIKIHTVHSQQSLSFCVKINIALFFKTILSLALYIHSKKRKKFLHLLHFLTIFFLDISWKLVSKY